jgi:hypothetical protein
MTRLSDGQILQARAVGLLDYLQRHEPGSIKKSGANEYCLREHDSFKLSNGKWFWFSQDYGGHSALDFLMKVRGMGFVDAVQSLTGDAGLNARKETSIKHKPQKSPKPFSLPKASANNDRVFAYLRGRGIGKDIINRCIRDGILYESAKGRCVFVGMDGDIPKFACERGIDDGWKKDVYGSDKKYSFSLPPENPNSGNLLVTESPVDALAHHSIHEIGQTGWDGHRLSLGGVGSAALTGFLERHPEIRRIYLALDNDKAGKYATDRIIKDLLGNSRHLHIGITIAQPPEGYKDYSDVLPAIEKLNIDRAKPDRRIKAAFSI